MLSHNSRLFIYKLPIHWNTNLLTENTTKIRQRGLIRFRLSASVWRTEVHINVAV